MKKEQMQKKLDALRRDRRSFQKGTSQFMERAKLEQLLDNKLYEKD